MKRKTPPPELAAARDVSADCFLGCRVDREFKKWFLAYCSLNRLNPSKTIRLILIKHRESVEGAA